MQTCLSGIINGVTRLVTSEPGTSGQGDAERSSDSISRTLHTSIINTLASSFASLSALSSFVHIIMPFYEAWRMRRQAAHLALNNEESAAARTEVTEAMQELDTALTQLDRSTSGTQEAVIAAAQHAEASIDAFLAQAEERSANQPIIDTGNERDDEEAIAHILANLSQQTQRDTAELARFLQGRVRRVRVIEEDSRSTTGG